MELALQAFTTKEKIKTIIIDFIALAVIYFVPAFAHSFGIPLFYAEPLRIMLILSVLHTRKENAYILALTLPFFSFLVSGHPVFFKMLIIITELALNVWLFLYLLKKMENIIFPMLISIVISKVVYYAIKFLFISIGLLTFQASEQAILPQIIMTLIFSAYAYLILKKKSVIK